MPDCNTHIPFDQTCPIGQLEERWIKIFNKFGGYLLMEMFISKTRYIEYLRCAKNAWLKFHKEEELKKIFEHSDSEKLRFEQGNDVEFLAQEIFTGGICLYEKKELRDNQKPDTQELAFHTQKYVERKSPILT